jgi:eukaryotic-like serine/threonine-protein kinase
MRHAGPFELLEHLGGGAMGEVWRATSTWSPVPVAVKLLAAKADTAAARARFHDEARAAARLDHPNVALVLDYGVDDESPWIAMELAEAGALSTFSNRLRWVELQAAVVAVLDGLAHAHARGVVHLDIKPDNVLLSQADDGRQGWKVADFGIAASMGEARDWVAGTPYYMAPEQWHGAWRDFGPWTDLYALGCSVWSMVMGRPPYRGTTVKLALQHTASAAPSLRSSTVVPRGLHRWVSRLMASDIQARFASAADAARALAELGPAPDDACLSTAWADPSSAALGTADTVEDRPTRPVGFGQQLTGLPTINLTAMVFDPPAPMPKAAPAPERPRPSLTAVPATWRHPRPPSPPPALLGVGLGALSVRRPLMDGRDEECDHLWSALRDVQRTGMPHVVVLSGAPGVGKSRLGEWIGERASETGTARFVSIQAGDDALWKGFLGYLRCGGLEGEELRLRLAQTLTQSSAPDLAGDAEPPPNWRPESEGIRTLHDALLGQAGMGQSERISAVQRLLSVLSSKRPLVLLLDDASGYPERLDLVQRVLGATELLAPELLIVLTVDDRGALPAWLLGSDRCRQLPLAPLSDVQIRRVIESLAPLAPTTASRVVALASGNPMFAVHVVRAWAEAGALEPRQAGLTLEAAATVLVAGGLAEVWSARVAEVPLDPVPSSRGA